MRFWTLAMALAVAIGCVLGCQPEVKNPSNPKFLAKIRQKAQELAESEMAKFNAIELTYKEVVDSKGNVSPVDPSIKMYFRAYRDFSGYEIKDLLYRPESLMKPLTFVIQYNYRTFSTQQHDSSIAGAEERAETETQFSIFIESNLLRAYPCDPEGNYDGSLPEMPPRDDMFWPPGYADFLKSVQPTAPPDIPTQGQGNPL